VIFVTIPSIKFGLLFPNPKRVLDMVNSTVKAPLSGSNSSGESLSGITRVREEIKAGAIETEAKRSFRQIPIEDFHSLSFPENKCRSPHIFVGEGVEL